MLEAYAVPNLAGIQHNMHYFITNSRPALQSKQTPFQLSDHLRGRRGKAILLELFHNCMKIMQHLTRGLPVQNLRSISRQAGASRQGFWDPVAQSSIKTKQIAIARILCDLSETIERSSRMLFPPPL